MTAHDTVGITPVGALHLKFQGHRMWTRSTMKHIGKHHRLVQILHKLYIAFCGMLRYQFAKRFLLLDIEAKISMPQHIGQHFISLEGNVQRCHTQPPGDEHFCSLSRHALTCKRLHIDNINLIRSARTQHFHHFSHAPSAIPLIDQHDHVEAPSRRSSARTAF